MHYSEILTFFDVKQNNGDRAKAVCPAHKDKQASLSIDYNPEKGATGVYCHAGCQTKDILQAAGLEMRDLFDKPLDDNTVKKDGIVAVYKYLNEDGSLLFEKVRFEPKRFSQRRYSGNTTIWGLDAGTYYETYVGSNQWSRKQRDGVATREFPGIVPTIYNLPAVIKANTVFIVEGEKDCDNLIKLGLCATTSFSGASKAKQSQKWKHEYNHYFQGKKVVLIPDNDEPGRAHMQYVAGQLQGIAESVKLVELKGLDEKGDVSDWIEQGHTKEELLKLVDLTEEYDAEAAEVKILAYNFSDVGNAERLVALYGKNLRFSSNRGRWLVWNGKYWQVDEDGHVERLAQAVVRKIQDAGEELPPEQEEAKASIRKFVLRSETDSRLKAMVNQARIMRGIPASMDDMDRDKFLMNLDNGTLDLRTGKLYKHCREDNITRIVRIEYDEKADCPNWRSFIRTIFDNDTELMSYVQKAVGYTLTGATTEQCFFMLYGNGANGKSTFLHAISEIMGDYEEAIRGKTIMKKQNNDGASGDLAKLQGKRFVVCSELNEGDSFDEDLIKQLTGGEDAIAVRFMYAEEFKMRPQLKLWIGTNEKPKIKGTNHGVWRRPRLIPFLHTFSDEEKNENFYEECIRPELPGILKWAVDGCLLWQKEGLAAPEKVKLANEEYRGEMDVMAQFFDDCCVLGSKYTCKVSELYDVYCKWCEDNRVHEVSSIILTKKLKDRGYRQGKNMSYRYWDGIGITQSTKQESFMPASGPTPFDRERKA